MPEVLFRNRRNEKIEVDVVLPTGGKTNFALDVGQEHPVKCNEGDTLMWGWYPFFEPGQGWTRLAAGREDVVGQNTTREKSTRFDTCPAHIQQNLRSQSSATPRPAAS
jgi:hypothetical protein